MFENILIIVLLKLGILEQCGKGKIVTNYQLFLNCCLIYEPGERRETPSTFILSSRLMLARRVNTFLLTISNVQLMQLGIVL